MANTDNLIIVRIELQEETTSKPADYEALHNHMAKKWNLVRKIVSDKGVTKNLPYAMYCAVYKEDTLGKLADDIRNSIIDAEIWKNPLVLVMAVGARWAIRGN